MEDRGQATVTSDTGMHSLSLATEVRFATQNKLSSHLLLVFGVKGTYELFVESMQA